MLTTRLPSQRRFDCPEAVVAATGFKPPLVKRPAKVYASYAQAVANMNALGISLQGIMKRRFDRDFEPPAVPLLTADRSEDYEEVVQEAEANVLATADEFAKRLKQAGCGTRTFHGVQSCTFDFMDTVTTKGWTANSTEVSRHTHSLVGARQHRVDSADVDVPKRVREFLAELPLSVHPHLRIVTGLLVSKADHVESTFSRLTPFGELLRGTWDATKEAGRAVRSAVSTPQFAKGAVAVTAVGGGAWLMSALMTAAATAAQVAVVDPALCLGDIVLYGWEDS